MPPLDAGEDASSFDADVEFFDGCARPLCPPAPAGCRYQGATACACGDLICDCGDGECSATQYCDFTGTCSGAGTCASRPETCSDEVALVCGCNGETYTNECEAHSYGVSVAATGACPSTADCRGEEGCPVGQACNACPDGAGVIFICLPDGVDC